MKRKGCYDSENLCCSAIYGGGLYAFTDQVVQDPLCGDQGGGQLSPLLVNVISGEQYFMKRLDCSPNVFWSYVDRIVNLPSNTPVLWPYDIVQLTPQQRDMCSLFVEQEHSPNPSDFRDRAGDVALLFPYGGYPRVQSGLRKLAQIEEKNWKSAEIRSMAVQIALALERMNSAGYIYADIHLSRIYFDDDGRVILDFSNLIYSVQETLHEDREIRCKPKALEYPPEFADPAVVRGLVPAVDVHSQNYSICALFFRLFFGRFAYDGRLLTGYADDSRQNYYMKFRDYHKIPVFIFDPDDTQNALGAFDEEQEIIDLWQELPSALRQVFLSTLRQSNAERKHVVNNPTPSTWLKVFEELGWYNKGKDGVL